MRATILSEVGFRGLGPQAKSYETSETPSPAGLHCKRKGDDTCHPRRIGVSGRGNQRGRRLRRWPRRGPVTGRPFPMRVPQSWSQHALRSVTGLTHAPYCGFLIESTAHALNMADTLGDVGELHLWPGWEQSGWVLMRSCLPIHLRGPSTAHKTLRALSPSNRSVAPTPSARKTKFPRHSSLPEAASAPFHSRTTRRARAAACRSPWVDAACLCPWAASPAWWPPPGSVLPLGLVEAEPPSNKTCGPGRSRPVQAHACRNESEAAPRARMSDQRFMKAQASATMSFSLRCGAQPSCDFAFSDEATRVVGSPARRGFT